MWVGVAFVLTGLMQAAIAVALFFWGQSIAARRRFRPWGWASFLPLLALFLATSGGIGSAISLVQSFDLANEAAPEAKEAILSGSLGDATRMTALTVGVAWVMYVFSVILFTVGTFLPMPSAPRREGSATAQP